MKQSAAIKRLSSQGRLSASVFAVLVGVSASTGALASENAQAPDTQAKESEGWRLTTHTIQELIRLGDAKAAERLALEFEMDYAGRGEFDLVSGRAMLDAGEPERALAFWDRAAADFQRRGHQDPASWAALYEQKAKAYEALGSSAGVQHYMGKILDYTPEQVGQARYDRALAAYDASAQETAVETEARWAGDVHLRMGSADQSLDGHAPLLAPERPVQDGARWLPGGFAYEADSASFWGVGAGARYHSRQDPEQQSHWFAAGSLQMDAFSADAHALDLSGRALDVQAGYQHTDEQRADRYWRYTLHGQDLQRDGNLQRRQLWVSSDYGWRPSVSSPFYEIGAEIGTVDYGDGHNGYRARFDANVHNPVPTSEVVSISGQAAAFRESVGTDGMDHWGADLGGGVHFDLSKAMSVNAQGLLRNQWFDAAAANHGDAEHRVSALVRLKGDYQWESGLNIGLEASYNQKLSSTLEDQNNIRLQGTMGYTF